MDETTEQEKARKDAEKARRDRIKWDSHHEDGLVMTSFCDDERFGDRDDD